MFPYFIKTHSLYNYCMNNVSDLQYFFMLMRSTWKKEMIRRFITTWLDQQVSTAETPTSIRSKGNDFVTGKKVFPSPGLESLEWLFSMSPCFPVRGNSVTIIQHPNDFYQTLISRCASAKRRILLASLYLGTGDLEASLVNTLHKNLKENSDLNVRVLLDFTRGTRGETKNSKNMLLPLVREFSENFSLSLYHTPVLRGITKRLAPPRFNELLGLQHMKIYLFDDSVIISGANLSNDYFTNRQDRYIMIEDRKVADFFSLLVEKVQEFSLLVQKNSEVNLHSNWELLPYEAAKCDFAAQAKERINSFFEKTFIEQDNIDLAQNNADTWIFPLVEMGQLGIHHDSVVTKKLLKSAIASSSFRLASGYFNLTQEYMDVITSNCLGHCKFLIAHPNANGFQGASGPAGGIPAAYSLIAKNFYNNLVKKGQDHRVELYEYQKEGWSYHAKGLWYYLPDSSLPNLTLIGSSNFGERSVNRDLEAQVCIVTSDPSLRKRLQDEVDNLYKLGTKAESDISSRPVPKWVKAVVQLFRNYF